MSAEVLFCHLKGPEPDFRYIRDIAARLNVMSHYLLFDFTALASSGLFHRRWHVNGDVLWHVVVPLQGL